MASPTVLDTLPVAATVGSSGSSITISYTVPAGSNKLTCVLGQLGSGGTTVTSATLNGVAATSIHTYSSSQQLVGWFVTFLSPTTGNMIVNFSGSTSVPQCAIVTLGGAAQSSPVDVYAEAHNTGTSDNTTATNVTTVDNDLLFAWSSNGGNSQMSITTGYTQVAHDTTNQKTEYAYKAVGAAGSYTAISTGTGNHAADVYTASIKPFPPSGPVNLKTWNGIGNTNIKNLYDAVTIGNIIKWNEIS